MCVIYLHHQSDKCEDGEMADKAPFRCSGVVLIPKVGDEKVISRVGEYAGVRCGSESGEYDLFGEEYELKSCAGPRRTYDKLDALMVVGSFDVGYHLRVGDRGEVDHHDETDQECTQAVRKQREQRRAVSFVV